MCIASEIRIDWAITPDFFIKKIETAPYSGTVYVQKLHINHKILAAQMKLALELVTGS